MYLKSIEIQGFKSFANKMRFEFHNGITAIVGPNGSGKSNVADAVRWVLGEQRVKQLRGASMQDVIFAGTQERKPQSYAYVAITLDNSDHALAAPYEEVTVARRIYRSGESEYLLNGSACRLKDVNELFYDTGIGKEGYSIIGQGQIERILSDKPEDRRQLFDEAAGIVKFKRRKEASVKKLEDERANMVRIGDILSELEKQVGPLEEQAKKAHVYLEAREKLKVLDVNVFLSENEELRAKIRDLTQKASNAEEELEAARTQFEQIRTEYDTVQNGIENLDKEIEETRNKITNTDIVRGRLEGDIKVYEEQIRAAQSNVAHFTGRKDSVAELLKAQEDERARIGGEKEKIDAQVEELRNQRSVQNAQLEEIVGRIRELTESSDRARETILDILNKRAQIKSKQASLETLSQETQIRQAELTSRLVGIQSDENRQNDVIRELEETFAKITQEITSLQETKDGIEADIAGKKQALSDSDARLREVQQSYHQDQSKLEALRNLTERYEGFGGSVRRVMEHKKSEKGLIGVVADLIKTDKKYETAIEVALGGNIQNVVTEDEDTAKRMIEMLKREKGGRATFLPLTRTNDPQEFKTPEVLDEEGVIGLADSIVETDAKYRNIAKTLLGRIVVVDSFDNAVRIGRRHSAAIRMVTVEGEMFAPGGAITGGTFKNSSNLLGSRRELSELEKKIGEEKAEEEKLLKEISEIKTGRNDLRAKLEEVNTQLQQLFISQNTARVNVTREKEKKDEFTGSYESLKAENAQIEDKIKELEMGRVEIAKELEESARLEEENNALIAKADEELTGIRAREEEKSAEVAKWDVEIEKMLQKVTFEQENLDRIDAELERLRGEEKEIVDTMEQAQSDITEKQKNIEEITKTIETSHTVQADDDRRLKEMIAKKEEMAAQQKDFFEKRESLSSSISALDKEFYRLSTQKEGMEANLEKQINYMWDEYQITLSDAESLKTEGPADIPEMKKEIASLKGKIRGLGPVNVNAIEEYQEVNSRYTFLKGQHDDLIEAEKTLQNIIKNLDDSMRRQFREQFGLIQSEFDKVFKELFGGGQGRLELVEDEDILEAGVRVIAQPPGKTLTNMMQLSGGEKSLTAIALLFAIQNLKPSPFCLLDEIEASLDENNVVRFSDYLHNLTKNTQFIVITHRRGTMERADRLYGITMQEKGISTLVSVNLIDKELTA